MRYTLLLLLLCAAPLWMVAQPADSSQTAQSVKAGIYLMNVYDLDINRYSFYADFYLWFNWTGSRDPMNIEFVNAVEKWGFSQTPFHEEAQEKADGGYYNGMRTEGRFYHSFDLRRFPLDRHELDIRIENVDYPLDSLRFIPDTASSLFRKDFVIPGWHIDRARLSTRAYTYETAFGEPEKQGSRFSDFTLLLTISRPLSYFLLKLLLPLAVVMLASLGSLFIHPSYIDARISLPIGGLLSCVFLQQSYSSALPDVGYMVLMDKIYLLAYVLIALIMLRVILAGNALLGQQQADPVRLLRIDKRWAFIFFLLFGIGVLTLVGWD